jgi:hypothetical protein
VNFTPWWHGLKRVDMVGLDGYPQSGPGWGLYNFQELFGPSFTEMRSLTSLPVFISETDLAPLSTSQDCDGGSYQSITAFIADLFADGGDGILQFQDGTPALTSAQWTELDAALAKAPNPAPAPASSPVPSPAPTSTPAESNPGAGHGDPGAAEPVAARVRGREPGTRCPAARLVSRRARPAGLRLRGCACLDSLRGPSEPGREGLAARELPASARSG